MKKGTARSTVHYFKSLEMPKKKFWMVLILYVSERACCCFFSFWIHRCCYRKHIYNGTIFMFWLAGLSRLNHLNKICKRCSGIKSDLCRSWRPSSNGKSCTNNRANRFRTMLKVAINWKKKYYSQRAQRQYERRVSEWVRGRALWKIKMWKWQ